MRRIALASLVVLSALPFLHAADQPTPKLKALLISGGLFHDYQKINPVMTDKLPQLASLSIDIKMGLDALKDPKFADGYDVVLYNFCFADEKDNTLIENALRVTREGKPTVMIHCAMHT